ncbi:hypothetical protein [Cellulomonas sp. Marseille-Q8402]
MTTTVPTTAPPPTVPGALTAPGTAVAPAAPHVVAPTSPEELAAATAARHGRSTPAQMGLVAVALVVLGLLVSLGAGWAFRTADGALGRADANAAQLIRLQELQTRLVRADADATNAFLVGGLEPAELRTDYDEAMRTATALVAEAARAQPADGTVLAQLNTAVLDYANDVERARSANRQGLPVGSQYLRNASAGLRADALPALDALIDANSARVEHELAAARTTWLLAVGSGVAGLAGVVVASVWLARRTHRRVNPPLAAAGLVLLVLTVGSGIVLLSVSSQVRDVSDTDYAAADALSTARLGAYDAKANESLTLIARGSGAAFEEAWVASADQVDAALDAATGSGVVGQEVPTAWAAYADQHAGIRQLDDDGDWEAAVAAATDRAEGSSNAAFAAFDDASAAALDRAGDATSDALDRTGRGLVLGLWLSVAAGLAVAVLSWSGISRRIEEYR